MSGDAATVAAADDVTRLRDLVRQFGLGGGGTHESDEPVEREGGSAVVSAVVEGRNLIVLPARETILKERASRRVQRSHRLQHTQTMTST